MPPRYALPITEGDVALMVVKNRTAIILVGRDICDETGTNCLCIIYDVIDAMCIAECIFKLD